MVAVGLKEGLSSAGCGGVFKECGERFLGIENIGLYQKFR